MTELPEAITRERREYLLKKCKNDEKAKEELISGNLRLVAFNTKKFQNTGYDTEDLISVGTIGLIKAINTFNPEKSKFSVYASECINNEIRMVLRKEKTKKREKDNSNIFMQEIISVDNDGCAVTLENFIEDTKARFEGTLIKQEELKTALYYTLNYLSTLKKIALLKASSGKSKKEVADYLGFSRTYVSRRIAEARKDLKDLIKKETKEKKYSMYNVKVKDGIYTITIKYNKPYELANYIKQNYEEIHIKMKIESDELRLIFENFDEDGYEILAEVVKYIEK